MNFFEFVSRREGLTLGNYTLDFNIRKKNVLPSVGFEPTTRRLLCERSDQLSYEGLRNNWSKVLLLLSIHS